MTQKKQEGQLMIESIVGISLVVVGLLGVVTLLIRSSHWNRDAGLKLQATYLAAEGIEVVKNIIDTNIADMLGGSFGTVQLQWNDGFASGAEGEYELDYMTIKGGLRDASQPLRVLGFDPALGYAYHGSAVDSLFRRKVTVRWNEQEDKVLVRSEVSWGGESVRLEDIFTFWRRQGQRPQ